MSGVLEKFRSWLFAEDGEGGEGFGADEEAEPPRRRGRLIPLHSRSSEIHIRRPRTKEEAQICIDCLRGRRAVIVNLRDVQPEDALRVFDFLTGACYALGGQVEPAGDKVYLVTPHNIGIMAEEEATQIPVRQTFWQEV